jgi:sugar phosphate isomerase/epimerase
VGTIDRRQFLKKAGFTAGTAAAAFGPAVFGRAAAPPDIFAPGGLRLGIASYTFRAFGLAETLAMIRRLGVKRVSLKSFHLPLESSRDQIRAIAAQTRAAGLELYGGGVIYMTSEAEILQAFEYAKAAGLEMIIGVPNPELLSSCERMVRRYDIRLAIHNHGPTDKLYPSPQSVYDRIRKMDGRVGLCLDVGHTQRCGIDPAAAAARVFDRLLDVHIKDVSSATAAGDTLEAGRGVVNLPELLRTLLRLKYAGTCSLEYEKDEKDPLPGAAESIGYIRGVLAAVAAP